MIIGEEQTDFYNGIDDEWTTLTSFHTKILINLQEQSNPQKILDSLSQNTKL